MRKFIIGLLIVGAIVALASTNVRNARLVSNLTVYENLITPTTSTFIEQSGLNETVNYRDGLTRNDADSVWADTVLVSGDIDLTSLTNSLGESISFEGQRIVAIKFKLQDVEDATAIIENAASESYPLFGATYAFTLKANQSLLYKADTILADVATNADKIKYTITEGAILYIILITANME